MNDARVRKLQYLLISQLLEKGSVALALPDGIRLEIGITQEDEQGRLHKTDDYCYVVATRGDRSAILDTYNLGVQFEPTDLTVVCEDDSLDGAGRLVRSLDVV